MKLGILGGTFDPIHFGHLMIAERTRESLELDRVLFVPAGEPPHKQDQAKTPGHHRQMMTALAIEDNARFALSTVDLERAGPNYSVETVRQIRSDYDLPAARCIFIIGSDSLVDLSAWYRAEELIRLCRLAVVHRPGYRPDLAELEAALPGLRAALDWVESPSFEVSSTFIRAAIRAGRSVRYLTPDRVIGYIEEQQLYGKT